jgi:hypothetical protein
MINRQMLFTLVELTHHNLKNHSQDNEVDKKTIFQNNKNQISELTQTSIIEMIE